MPSPSSSNDEVDTAVSDVDSTLLAENVDHRFELRDLNVRFPEGQLSLITGPTASGKTALLVRRFVSQFSLASVFNLYCYRVDGTSR